MIDRVQYHQFNVKAIFDFFLGFFADWYNSAAGIWESLTKPFGQFLSDWIASTGIPINPDILDFIEHLFPEHFSAAGALYSSAIIAFIILLFATVVMRWILDIGPL